MAIDGSSPGSCTQQRLPPRSRRPPCTRLGCRWPSIIGSPGADDNASGVAALLALSRRFTVIEPERTVRVVAFVNEEPPLFLTRAMGSRVYAAMARKRGDGIALMICLESLGYYCDDPGSRQYPPLLGLWHPTRGRFVVFVSNPRSRRALRALVARFREDAPDRLNYDAMARVVDGLAESAADLAGR